jgi:alginate O-acetyltransferase complex protein AlgI
MRLNLLIVMTLGGLWHGAAWTFVVWGLLHGLFLIIHKSWTKFEIFRLPALLSWLMTMFCVVFAFAIFRTSSWLNFSEFVAGATNASGQRVNRLAWAMIVAIFAIEQLLTYRVTNRQIAGLLPRRERSLGEAMAWGVVGSVALAVALFMAPGSSRSFIYFQF